MTIETRLHRSLQARILRLPAFFGCWVVLVGAGSIADLGVGVLVALLATWASLRLAPPMHAPPRLIGCVLLALRFLKQSLLAGWDVARRACDPRLPVQPGMLSYRSGLSAASAQEGFRALTSLAPGTLPVASEPDGTILYHCLDRTQPVELHLDLDCRAYRRAFPVEKAPAS